MITVNRIGIALGIGFALLTSIAAAQDPLTQAKQFYEVASYDDALGALNAAGNSADIAEVEKYRALCYLALGRSKEAEQSLEHLAMARPLLTLEDSDASPKLVALYHDVSKRTFPEASKQIYQRARSSFDKGDIAEAATLFKQVIALSDQAPPEHAALMGELKMLSAGFLKLTEAADAKPQATAANAKNTPAAANTAATNAAGAVAVPTAATTIYSVDNIAVRPPVSLERPVPPWNYRPDAFSKMAFQGRIEVVVDERGEVVDASILKSINGAYDRTLLNAAKKWRFQPATLDGTPVKYRVSYQLTVEPSKQAR